MGDATSPVVAFGEGAVVLPLELAEEPGGEVVKGGGGGTNSSEEVEPAGGGELADEDEEEGELVSEGGVEGDEPVDGGEGD